MATQDKNQIKRTINSRLRAFEAAGKDPDAALDSVLRMETISDSMRSKIKQAKASGQSQQAFQDLLQASSNATPEPVNTELGTGKLGGAARFLGIENLGKGLGARLARLDPQHRRNLQMIEQNNPEAAQELRTGGVTGRQMAGGAINLGLAAGGGALLTGGARNLAARATGKIAGTARGLTPAALSKMSVAKGVGLGAGAGYASDVGTAMSEGERGLETYVPGMGTAIGAVGGAVFPIARLIKNGKTISQQQASTLLKKITPDYADLTVSQRKQFAKQGRINPRTLTKGQELRLSDKEIAAATRHADVIADDPIVTLNNINDRLAKSDSEVGQFLLENNAIFPKKELKKAIANSMSDISDGVTDPAAIERAREKIIDGFLTSVDKNDMYSLWQARKAFDQRIERAFAASPSMQKEVKRALRNAVQDFIANKTPDKTYKTMMSDMSGLYNLESLAEISAGRQYAGSKLGEVGQKVGRTLGTIGMVGGAAATGAWLTGRGGGEGN